MRSITIHRPERPIRTAVRLPRSKSISNRALVCASLAGDLSIVREPSEAEDTRILHQLLQERPQVMHCGLGGTTFRFLLAWASIQEGEERLITGEPRLLERPHDDLVNALGSLGADITPVDNGFRVHGKKLRGGAVVFDSPISSQFISALMMIGPLMEDGLRIAWKGRRLSEPYVRMTAKVMEHFGASLEEREEGIVIPRANYRTKALTVPPDWSAAAFWYAIAGLATDAFVELAGLQPGQWQGDERIDELTVWCTRSSLQGPGLELRSIVGTHGTPTEIDLSQTPDLFQPLACLFAGKSRPVRFYGLGSLPHKESDRIQAMADALAVLGCAPRRTDDSFAIGGRITNLEPPPLDPRGDHRMAMALAPLALVFDRIILLDPDVVNKSYPGYWKDLEHAGFRIERS